MFRNYPAERTLHKKPIMYRSLNLPCHFGGMMFALPNHCATQELFCSSSNQMETESVMVCNAHQDAGESLVFFLPLEKQ